MRKKEVQTLQGSLEYPAGGHRINPHGGGGLCFGVPGVWGSSSHSHSGRHQLWEYVHISAELSLLSSGWEGYIYAQVLSQAGHAISFLPALTIMVTPRAH